MAKMLDEIVKANDIKKIDPHTYGMLAEEIREFLVEKVGQNGGHLASNLGVVELTMALHLVLDFPEDRLVWDVGHQAYVHKILTGRKEQFDTLRQFGGLSGFPKRRESDCDAFDTGHSSTSISAALGMATARDLRGTKEKVVAVIGDGALSGGMAFEALNNAARRKSNFVIVLNDNNMSISENVGGMASYLGRIRTGEGYQLLKESVETTLNRIPMVGEAVTRGVKKSKEFVKRLVLPSMLFEDMGLTYIGPIDGHNIQQVKEALEGAFQLKEPVLLHVVTRKGKGYSHAEKNPAKFHGVGPFDIRTGKALEQKQGKTYTRVFSEHLLELAEKQKEIVAVTAAMPGGTGLLSFRKEFPDRFFDVGIAEEHAVTFAAGLAVSGMKPVAAIYSTFLQRAYDQMIHDIGLNSVPVFFAVDRAGIVGSDGETHQGVFDLSYLTGIPNFVVAAPKNRWEMTAMMDAGIAYDGPFVLRYPKGTAWEGMEEYRQPVEIGRAEVIREGSRVLLLAIGSMVRRAEEVAGALKSCGVEAGLVNMRFAKPLDTGLLERMLPDYDLVVTMEENIKTGGMGQAVICFMKEQGWNQDVLCIALPDEYIVQGEVPELEVNYRLDAESITEEIKRKL